jgi:hypothetical protein
MNKETTRLLGTDRGAFMRVNEGNGHGRIHRDGVGQIRLVGGTSPMRYRYLCSRF